MYIQRITANIIPGCLDEAVEIINNEIGYSHANGRVLVPVHGPLDQLQMELRLQDLDEYTRFWKSWDALPTTPAFFESWPRVAAWGGLTELWEVKKPLATPPAGKIINRRTFPIQNWKMDEAVELLAAERELSSIPIEITSATFGPSDILIVDFPFESITAHDQAWAEWGQTDHAGVFMEKWLKLVTPGGKTEIWEVR